MVKTTSLAFPNMFDVAQNKVSVIADNISIVNRSRLLILTEPTELYMSPDFGVGLKRHLWQYNTENEKSIIQDRIKDQLRLHEPYVLSDKTQFADGLLYTGSSDDLTYVQDSNSLKMTVGLCTKYNESVDLEVEYENR